MAILTIRDFDEGLKAKLRVRAAEHGRSMEAEVRAILASVLTKSNSGPGMGSRIRQRFDGVDDLPVELPRRTERARAVEFPE
ncbi:FitA-like ribbon-helix-helix domain-containing protein [Umezawaea sp. Da 62-37]|uniref:FitA-like ribbon-helix-helix domain-containing protein n=1 Tax=Umezawaea sp. Da 62-37 TaxID=3075927 RepID=UPI0028F7427A|nr:Arc family DNA-binding protein [Umezawaea sp. Da 62-37]WNV89868.1 Arc family DNA-binding protein [Umezawaea sp. Da 62-37]